MSNTIGRNDPCVCGSGKKYKNCCHQEGRPATASTSNTLMYVLGAVVLLGLMFIVISLFGGGGEGACPPGQSFDVAHGHCH